MLHRWLRVVDLPMEGPDVLHCPLLVAEGHVLLADLAEVLGDCAVRFLVCRNYIGYQCVENRICILASQNESI